MSTLPTAERDRGAPVMLYSLAAGVVALVPCIIGAFFDPEQFFRAYLASYLFCQGLGLGCLAILMIYYCTGGAWGFLIRRFLEAGTRTLPFLALLLIPIGGGLRYLFLWARPEEVAADKNLQWKQIYLNVPFWWGRAVLFFAIFLGLTWLLNAWSRRQEESGDARYAWRLTNLSGPGLVAFGICMHFAAVDWLMSLQTAFKSSIFGPLLVSGQLVSALALVLIVLAWLSPRPPLDDVISAKGLSDLGNLLLAMLVIWAYMSFFQFMLIWIANLPHEIIWYIDRSQGGWQWVITAVAIFHFGLPFFLLLQRAVKRTPLALAAVAALVLFMHQVFLDWQVFPAFIHATSIANHWMDFLMPVGLGGLWFAYYLWQLGRRPLVPRHDENRPHALVLRREDREEEEREAVITHG